MEQRPKKFPISKILTSPFRGNFESNMMSGLGLGFLAAAFTLRNESEFSAELVKYFSLITGVSVIGNSLVMWRRTGVYYYKTIKTYQEMKKKGIKGNLVKRLENIFKNMPKGCKSFGVRLALRDLEQYEQEKRKLRDANLTEQVN